MSSGPSCSLEGEEGVTKKKLKISSDIADDSSNGSSKDMLLQTIPELMAKLPTEVVVDILLRLPVKPLLRFRCVSKLWLALIDCPRFAKLHLNHSIKARNNRGLILKLSSFMNRHVATYSINLDTFDLAVEIDLPLKVSYGQKFPPTVVGSCNGLFLLCYENYNGCDETILVIWNPFTRKYRKLPAIRIESPDYILKLKTYGMGYDSIHDDYKTVRMANWGRKDDLFSEVQVYSLKSNTWRRIPNFAYHHHLCGSYGVFCGGALHWLVSDKFSESRFVAAFDLATEEFQLVPVPNFIDKYDLHIHVAVLEGRLCMCNDRRESLDVWIMKNYGVGESWTKLYSFALPKEADRYFECIVPLAITKDGTQVLLKQNSYNLIWFDLEHNLQKRIDVHGLPDKFHVEFVMQSLVPLGSGSKTYGKEQHGEQRKLSLKGPLEKVVASN